MAERFTNKDATRCFERLTKVLGKRIAKSYDDAGAWQLDCNSTYGGCQVEEILKGGGVTTPLGNRSNPREFCEKVWFTEKACGKPSASFSGARGKKRRKRR